VSDELFYTPVLLPDGQSVVYQHTVHGAATATRVEQVGLDRQPTGLLIDDARQPAPSADGTRMVFVRYVDQHAELVVHSVADGCESALLEEQRHIIAQLR
jgi:hypothetical protein